MCRGMYSELSQVTSCYFLDVSVNGTWLIILNILTFLVFLSLCMNQNSCYSCYFVTSTGAIKSRGITSFLSRTDG